MNYDVLNKRLRQNTGINLIRIATKLYERVRVVKDCDKIVRKSTCKKR